MNRNLFYPLTIVNFKYFIYISLPIKRNLYISELIFHYISDLYNKI